MPTTPDTITAAQRGDQTAIAELYRQHHGTVHRYLAARVGRQLADDLAQDVWVRAIRALPTYRDTGRPIGAWLATIARNLVLDHAKRGATRYEVTTAVLADRPDPAGSVEDQVLGALDTAPVRAALGHLPAAHRTAMVLTYWAGLDTVQVAACVGRSPGAVRTMRCRATATLRRQLTPA